MPAMISAAMALVALTIASCSIQNAQVNAYMLTGSVTLSSRCMGSSCCRRTTAMVPHI
jgi:spore coat protein U-like protein